MPAKARMGRHRSSCKEGNATLAFVRGLPGVTAVMLGRSVGGKSIGRNAAAGDLKLQREEINGFKGVLQSSKGLQEIFISVDGTHKEAVRLIIAERFSK